MDETYNFRAPQYVDFSNAVNENENDDNDFFDFDMDTGVPLTNELTPTGEIMETEPATPYQDAEDNDDVSSTDSAESPRSWRHTSYKPQTLPRRSIFEGIELESQHEKSHSMKTRLDSITRTPRLELRSRSIVKAMAESPLSDHNVESPINQSLQGLLPSPHEQVLDKEDRRAVGKPILAPRKRKLSEIHHVEPPPKFISMAEHIRKIQKQTPARFRTKPRFDGITKKTFGGPSAPKSITIPHTPTLISQLRSRPVHALTREEQELKEFEEAQKKKFKAVQLKENHFKSSKVAAVVKKPPTQVKPFHITEYKPKPRVEDEAVVVFKARPVPKALHAGPKIEIPKKRKARTPPAPPKPLVKSHSVPPKTRTTIFKPFSFESRGFDPKAKRDKLIKEMEEQERKIKEFKARPLPSQIQAVAQSMPKRVKRNEDEAPPAKKFKARSPVVLKKAPFIPEKPARTPLEPKPFNLHSEARLQERQKFNLVIKQKELEMEAEKILHEEEEARRTADEVAKLRRQTVHHARPVPHYRQFEVKPSQAPLTNPHSPNLMKRARNKKESTVEVLNATFDIENP